MAKPFEEEEMEDFEEEYEDYGLGREKGDTFLYDEDDYQNSDSDYEGDD